MRISRGFHGSVNARIRRAHEEHDAMPFRGAVFAKVFAPDGDSELVNVDTVVGEKRTSFSYPFSSANSWIRGQPEETTTLITLLGAESKKLTPIGYYDPGKSSIARTYQSLVSGVRQNPGSIVPNLVQAYRGLAPGEIDMGSRYAQAYFGMRDVAQLRGGLSHHTMTSLYTRLETPLLRVEGAHHQQSGNLVDEIRYGTVRRAGEGTSSLPQLVRGVGARRFGAPGSVDSPLFAKEWSVLLDWMGDPAKLIDHRQGIVTNDDGSFPIGGPGRVGLRAQYRWFTAGRAGGLNFSTVEIDERGNVLFETSPDGTDGLVVSVPDGNFLMSVGETRGGEWSVVTQGDAQINTQNGARFAVVADGGFRINAGVGSRGEINAPAGLGLKSDGFINIDAAPGSGITLGARDKIKYPALVAHPDYLATLTNYYSSQASLASAVATYAGSAASAWASVGGLLNLLDPSGVVMGLCLNAGSAAGQVAAVAPQVPVSIGQHLPKLQRMPSGFISAKTVSQ